MTAVRAAVLREAGAPFTIEDIDIPGPGPGEVRVRMAATGVCHSDLSLATGVLPHPMPAVLGHEGAGTVLAAGDGVTSAREGDHVVLNWTPPCRECWYCARGEPYLCSRATNRSVTPYGTLDDGSPVHAGLATGAFATETVVGENSCVPIPDDIPLPAAALLGCAALTGVGAIRNSARVRAGESVTVIGLGGIGLCAVQAARMAGADPIIAVDFSAEKATLARRFGATETLRPAEDLTKRIRSLNDGRGTDHAVECVGRGETIRAAWSATRRGGRATVVGLGASTDPVKLDAFELGNSARTLAGCMYGSTDPLVDIPVLLEHYRAGELDLDALVGSHIGLDGIEAAFDEMRAGTSTRQIISF